MTHKMVTCPNCGDDDDPIEIKMIKQEVKGAPFTFCQEANKGVSMKEYLVETAKRGQQFVEVIPQVTSLSIL
nr:hypothetical protein [Tanacetum cinerariifolium]